MKKVPKEQRMYLSTIFMAPKYDTVKIYNFDTRAEADAKALKLKAWPYIRCVRARRLDGCFAKGFALICCK